MILPIWIQIQRLNEGRCPMCGEPGVMAFASSSPRLECERCGFTEYVDGPLEMGPPYQSPTRFNVKSDAVDELEDYER